jgi:nitrogen-specific signal transduction histidine kinase
MARRTETNSSPDTPQDVSARLRRLAHDLSNSLEAILQACYLLKQTSLPDRASKWVGMIESSAADAARTNRTLRETIRQFSEKQPTKRRAS